MPRELAPPVTETHFAQREARSTGCGIDEGNLATSRAHALGGARCQAMPLFKLPVVLTVCSVNRQCKLVEPRCTVPVTAPSTNLAVRDLEEAAPAQCETAAGRGVAGEFANHFCFAYSRFAERTYGKDPKQSPTRDEVLDDFTLYWLTNSAASSVRIYWEHGGRDLPRHMAARFDSLRNDDINASGRRPLGFPYGPYLMDDLHADSVGTLRITPEQREDGAALFQTDGHMIFDGEVQDQVHPNGLSVSLRTRRIPRERAVEGKVGLAGYRGHPRYSPLRQGRGRSDQAPSALR